MYLERTKEIKSSELELVISSDVYRYRSLFHYYFFSFFVKAGKANILWRQLKQCVDQWMKRKMVGSFPLLQWSPDLRQGSEDYRAYIDSDIRMKRNLNGQERKVHHFIS